MVELELLTLNYLEEMDVKERVVGLKFFVKDEETEKMNVKHHKSADTKENAWVRDNNNIFF